MKIKIIMLFIYELSHSFTVIKHAIWSEWVGALQRAGGLPPSICKLLIHGILIILFFLLHQVKQFMSRNKKLCVKHEIKVNLFTRRRDSTLGKNIWLGYPRLTARGSLSDIFKPRDQSRQTRVKSSTFIFWCTNRY